jgi:hypothetical protein
MQRLGELNDRPSFLGAQFPPLWTPDPAISIIGKGFALVFGDLISSIIHALKAATLSASSIWSIITNSLGHSGGIQNAPTFDQRSFDIIYRLWAMIRPTSLISYLFTNILQAVRWYQQKSTCSMGASTSFSLRNILAAFDYAICSFYPDVLTTSPRFRTLFRHWLLSALHSIATERSAAIVFGYIVTLSGLALQNMISSQPEPYMVFVLLKVSV